MEPDIVYMLTAPLPYDGIELKYSLRGLKNMPHGKVFMITPTLPDLVDPDKVVLVDHLPVGETKYDDLQIKWNWMGTATNMTDTITYMDDDYFIIKPVPRPKAFKLSLQPLWVILELYVREAKYNLRGEHNLRDTIINTMRVLKEQGIEEPRWPQQHFPWPVKRSNIPLHWDDGNGPYEWKTMEFNHNNPDPTQYPHECKVTTHGSLIQVMKTGSPYLSSQDGLTLYTSGLLTLLSMMFPEKSEYEQA